jgi:hypothetical protein
MERVREGRPLTVRDDKGNTLKCIAEIVELVFTVFFRYQFIGFLSVKFVFFSKQCIFSDFL